MAPPRSGRWLRTPYDSLCHLEPKFQNEFRIENALFIDTETTGLAGGTGTYAFLVGLGYFTPGGFMCRQLLMRDYNEEHALLYLLGKELDKKRTLVTFNGKSSIFPPCCKPVSR